MKLSLTNDAIYTIANVLMGNDKEPGLMGKKHLTSVMAVRHALKHNCAAISEKYKVVVELINETNMELFTRYLDEGKADKNDNEEIQIKDEFKDEFILEQRGKMDEMLSQVVECEFVSYPETKLEMYEEKNDGELTDLEMDILELFVEKPAEETKTE